jgi:hypothetical protein
MLFMTPSQLLHVLWMSIKENVRRSLGKFSSLVSDWLHMLSVAPIHCDYLDFDPIKHGCYYIHRICQP